MPFRILVVTATDTEADTLIKTAGITNKTSGFSLGSCDLEFLITGVGGISTAWAMTKWISSNPKPDLAINAGIAGSYKPEFKSGDVVIPVSDCFADAGIETAGGFQTLFEAGLEDPDRFPFSKGKIVADNKFITMATSRLRPVNAITVNTATGSAPTIERLIEKFNPDIETMEGATFFYICSRERLHFLAIRSISNRVEPRNRDKWNIPLALNNLSEKLKEFVLMLD